MRGGGGGMDGHFAKKLHHNARYSFLVCRRGSLLKNAWKNLHNKNFSVNLIHSKRTLTRKQLKHILVNWKN